MNLTNDQTRELLSTVPFRTLQKKSKELQIRPARSHIETVERMIQEDVGFSIRYSGNGEWDIQLDRYMEDSLIVRKNFGIGMRSWIIPASYTQTTTPSRR